MAATEPKTETDAPPKPVDVPEIKTVEVANVSKTVTDKDIWEFFSFSGNIHYIEMKSESETTQRAFVTFKESQGAKTALLLTGATIGDLSVSLSPVENYQLPADAPPLTPIETPANADEKLEVTQKAEEVVSTMLAKGFVLGKDALQKAKSFDERHQLSSNASATAVSIDQKMGLTQKLNTGAAAVNEKMKQVDERYQVSEKSKSAIAVAEQKATDAGSALMSNKYVSSGAVWVAGAFAAVAKVAEDVGSKTKEKVDKAEEEKEKEGSKTKEEKGESETKEEKEKSETKEEKGESKTKEEKGESETKEEKEKSETKEKDQKAEEGSNKDSPATPVKSSNENK